MVGARHASPAAREDVDDHLALFVDRADALGVRVDHLANVVEAARRIAEIADECAATCPLVAQELVDAAPALIAQLDAAERCWAVPAEATDSRDSPLGLSLARLAVAETGSLLLAEERLADRAIGMLCLSQLILCPTAALVPSLDEAVGVLRDAARRPGPGMATLVTGPSRTADIERVLTVGVQGPGRVYVLFVDELA